MGRNTDLWRNLSRMLLVSESTELPELRVKFDSNIMETVSSFFRQFIPNKLVIALMTHQKKISELSKFDIIE